MCITYIYMLAITHFTTGNKKWNDLLAEVWYRSELKMDENGI